VLSRGGQCIELTADHAPDRPDEHARVLAAGGKIIANPGPRVMGALSMTRALGDHVLQNFGVSPEPEVSL